MDTKIAVIGLGYVGLPVALAFAQRHPGTVGFDINDSRVQALKGGEDLNKDSDPALLKNSPILFTSEEEDLRGVNFYVVAVPTPVDRNNKPDLSALKNASLTVGRTLRKGAIIVYESTVYPGVTEEYCGPIIAQASGLVQGKDFHLGYSPERINPGDREHTLERIVKVVSGDNDETLDTVAKVYGSVVDAGIHRAPSIKVAEAAKVIENTQRDLNIALMNELALIFDRMGIATRDVLDAAQTKWNFLKFSPGLVGGHCIGVDPYYLTTKAELLGYHPQVILAGRRINDGMGAYVAQKTIKMMIDADIPIKGARIGVFGITFKENVSDVRNSRVPDIVRELREFGVAPLVYDPLADPEEVEHEYGISMVGRDALNDLDGCILAVAHHQNGNLATIENSVKKGGILIDVKSVLERRKLRSDIQYWSL